MALIPGYEYDIFISYAHVDNIAFPGQKDGWIEQFYKNLNLMLAQRFGRLGIARIWWDNKKLDGSVLFDQSIEDGIKKSATMICLYSPGYIASDYCKQELELFYKKAQNEKVGLKVADRSRIINVLLNNIPHTQWPKALRGTTGFPFHDAKESDDLGDPVDTLSTEFRTQMQDTRDAVCKLLNDFLNEQSPGTVQQQPEQDDEKETFTLYLAEVADTLRTPRKRLITELEKKGFTIVTGVPPPDETAAHEQATTAALQKADLAIHLLDEYPGREIIGDPTVCYPQKQVELTLHSGKAQMIWVPAETNFDVIEEEKYRLFLQELEAGKASSTSYEFVRGSKSTLAQEIMDFAAQVKTQQMQKQAEKGKISVLLDTHFMDQLYAVDLYKTLVENQIQPFLNPQEDDPRKNMDEINKRLGQVKKLIFLYGSVSKEWVLERMSAALQLIITNNYPIEDFFIYMAPPHKEAADISLNQKFLKVNVVNSSSNDSMTNDEMQQFLHALKAGTV